MNPSRYFIPQMGTNPIMYPNNSLNISYLFNRLGNSIKNFNWKGMLSGVNKTLNVVNQTIPLVKQAKPMYDNIKSMFLLTKAFNKETNPKIIHNTNISQKNITNTKDSIDINKPNFFI